MATLAVVTITLNEERQIERCLSSVRWADEIIVVDSLSTDRTVEIARRFTSKVYLRDYPGSTRQMEQGISYASSDWILFLDADEEVTPELADEIRDVLKSGTAITGFEILRRPWAFGRWIEHGGWFPDWQCRLIRKDSYTVNHAEVHGGFSTTGPHGRLTGMVNHFTYPTIAAYLSRMNDYTSLEVANRLAARPDAAAHWYNMLLSPLSHFLRMYISRTGVRDGMQGFILSVLDALYSFALYAKLWEYRRARREGRATPPITNAELNVMKRPA
ncbi:MAG: glycosyltransferase family 2 protein [Bacteroidota bacterium]